MSTQKNSKRSKTNLGNPKMDSKAKTNASLKRGKNASSGITSKGKSSSASKTDRSNRKGGQKTNSNSKSKQSQVKPTRARTNTTSEFSRAKALGTALSQLWDVPARYKNDDFIIDSITGKRANDLSLWSSLNIQRYRTVTNLLSKIKTGTPLRSDVETIAEFRKTQIEPILGDRYSDILKSKIDEVFADFPYQDVLDDIRDPHRRPIITNGASYPAALAPVIVGLEGNAELIAGMAVGRSIYASDFHMEHVLRGLADGKLTTVPKNYKTNRTITIGSRTMTDTQYVPSTALRNWVTVRSERMHHIIQFDDQTVQHQMLKAGNATIDLSSASDRVYRSLIEKVWPDFMTYFGAFLPKDVVDDEGRITTLTCVGTQGFPLTFTMMAVVIGLIVEAVKTTNKPSANYGDDIIIDEADFNEVYTALHALGLVVNVGKTHKSSDGFLESCGRDVRFTSNGSRDITPVYLRGESDVEIIQFFYQLCNAGLIDVEDATSILDRLNVTYYAFNYEYQLTEFHLPFGDVKNVPKKTWSTNDSHYVCKVPALKQVVSSIKGLSKKESEFVLELLHIEAGFKNPNNSKKYIRGLDPVARSYALVDLQDHKLYGLYKALDTADGQVPVIFYEELEKQYNTTFKALCYYRFITSELYRYRYSTATIDFNDLSVQDFSVQELINTEYGVKSEVRYPIYRYKVEKGTKTITHPLNNTFIGIDEIRQEK